MKFNVLPGILSGTALLALAAPATATIVYSQDFSALTLANKPNAYLGGFYGPQLAFGEWVRSYSDVTVNSGTLQAISDTDGFRGAGVFLSPSLFPSAGNYALTFDITGFSGEQSDAAAVSI